MYKILKVYDHVVHDVRLTTLREKYLVSYIWSWQEQSKCCFASDEFLSSLLCCDNQTLYKLLSDLQKRRILKINQGNGQARMLSVLVNDETPGCPDDFDIFNEVEF